jgi:putative endonuclease
MWWVYIIKSQSKNWYYVGSTNRLKLRICEHNDGKVKSTRSYLPFTLVYKRSFEEEKAAREYERLIKDKRILKESIINQAESS